MKTCKREGCCAKVTARGLCNNHYTQWRRKNPFPLAKSDTRERVLAAMPGTMMQIAAGMDVTYEAVRKAVRKLHAEGLCHIEDHEMPDNCGRNFTAVYAAGPGEDHKVTKKMRHENHLRNRRAWYARNDAKPRLGAFDLVMLRMAA